MKNRSNLKVGRGLALAVCTTLLPLSAAQAEKNLLGLENPQFGKASETTLQQNPPTTMNCPEIRFLGNSIPDCSARGAMGPVREDMTEPATRDHQKLPYYEYVLGGKGTF